MSQIALWNFKENVQKSQEEDVKLNQVNEKAKKIAEQIKAVLLEDLTEEQTQEFKQIILQTLNAENPNESTEYSTVSISLMDQISSPKKVKDLVLKTLKAQDVEKNQSFTVYKDNIWININEDGVQFWPIKREEESQVLLKEVKDLLLSVFIEELIGKKVCLQIKLKNGYKDWEFFDCKKKYEEPKDNWVMRIIKMLGE